MVVKIKGVRDMKEIKQKDFYEQCVDQIPIKEILLIVFSIMKALKEESEK